MALLDLSKVTRTLKTLLEQNIARPDMGSLTVTVTPQPPEQVGAAQNTLSLHLYHVAEEAYYKNTPGPGVDIPNVARNPMALCLYYILTAHHESTDRELDPFTQQNLMGLAIKTLHDFPVITDNTVVNGAGTPLLAAQGLDGADNTIQIIMRPIAPEEAISFWSTEEQQTARLSAYYEVRVIMLQPERPRTMPGIVYALGTFVVNIGSPFFECSRNLVSFPLPPSTGLTQTQRIEATPARASTDTGDPQFPNNRLNLIGRNLTVGKSRTLTWKNALWAKQGFEAVTIDPALSPGWSLDFRSDRIQVDIAPTVSPDGVATLTVFPGLYRASLRVVKDEEVILNHLKQITDSSNEVSLFVAPRIAPPHSAPGPDGRITVNLEPTFDLTHGTGTDEELEIQLIIDGRVYERGFLAVPPAAPADNDGRFDIAASSITFQPLFTTPGERLFRLMVNGAESQPFWIVTP